MEEDAFRQCFGAKEDDAGVRSLAEGGLLQEPWGRKAGLESSFGDCFSSGKRNGKKKGDGEREGNRDRDI